MAKANKSTKKAKSAIASLSPKERKEVFVNHRKKLHLNFVAVAAEGSENFEYTLTLNSVTVSLLDINGTSVSPIKQSGKAAADTGKPFFVQVNASLNGPTGSGSLQLKFLPKDKNLFDSPQEFKFEASGNGGLFLPDVKLP